MHRVQQRPLVVGMLYPVCWRVGGYTAYPPGKESLSWVNSAPLFLPALSSPNTSFINPGLAAVTNQPQMCWGLKQKECASRLWTRPRPGCSRWVGGSAPPRHSRAQPPRELHCCGWVWVSPADLPRSPHGRSWGRGHGAGRRAVPLRTLGTLWWWANRADKERGKHTLAVAFGPSYLSKEPPSFRKGANSPSNGAMPSERKPPFPGNMRHGAPTQHRRLSTA